VGNFIAGREYSTNTYDIRVFVIHSWMVSKLYQPLSPTRVLINMSPLTLDATKNDLTYRVIGAAMAVHNKIGLGFKEEVYERALEVELIRQDIAVQRQVPVPVEYEGVQVAVFYLDLMVEDKVVVEIKALSHQLTNDERAQVINYLKATGAPVGLLFNFGRRALEYKRIFPGNSSVTPVQRTGRDNVLRK
jgi:GxxExxY protein